MYNPTATKEKVTVKEQKGGSFILAWTTDGQGNPTGRATSNGTVSFAGDAHGLVNTDWTSSPPPAGVPDPLRETAQCGNSPREHVLQRDLGDPRARCSRSRCFGARPGRAPAGRRTTSAARTGTSEPSRSGARLLAPVRGREGAVEITQVGALGDPYGSGVRTVWWVYGVGPVKISFAMPAARRRP